MNLNLYNLSPSPISNFSGTGFIRVRHTILIALAVVYSIPLFSQTAPLPPTSVSASPAAVCQGNSTTLRATSVGNTIKWYITSNGGNSIGATASGAGLSVSPSAATTYYAEAINSSGIASDTRSSVTVTVNTVPVLTYIPPDVSAYNAPGQCGTVVVYPQALASGIPTPTILYSNPSGQNFSVGTTTVLTTAVNTCGNTSLSFDVNVFDNEPPVVLAPPDVNVTLPPGVYTLSSSSLGTPNATDNCGVVTITNNAPSAFGGGTTTVTWTATDEDGHSASASQQVTVVVQTPIVPARINGITSNDADNTVAQNSAVTLNIGWDNQQNGGPYKVDIDWRDSSAHTVIQGITTNSASVSHTYNKTGVFAPVVIESNSGNFSDTSIFKFLVVYVVGNYSTTANGEFTAPPGALVSMPNLSLRNSNVSFGVQCKPQSCHPGVFDGDLDLEMGGAHFDFETEDVDWDYLAVSACFLAQFQGSGYMYPNGHKAGCHGGCHGKCNPTGYHFGILVVQSDKKRNPANANMIRVKIWNKDNGSLVFDTQPGDPDNALPTTPFNGNIKVSVPASCIARMDAEDAGPAGTFQALVSPNPFISVFTLNVTSASDDNVSVDIFDILGKRVQSISDVLPNQPISINNNLQSGLYFVHVKQGSNTQIVRLLKDAN